MGGGGSSGNNYYQNQDRLLGVQADVAQNLYNQYAQYSPAPVDAMSGMATEAMNGDLGERMRAEARASASANSTDALSSALGGAQRSMERYGSSFNPNRVNANLTSAALGGAAMRATGLNTADAAAAKYGEDQGWARNADFYSALSGMPGTAVSALNSAAGGYGGMASDQTKLQAAGAQGAGQFGSAVAYGLMRADGGMVEYEDLEFADGGMPRLTDWRGRPSNVRMQEAPSPMMSAVQGAMPTMAIEGLKHGMSFSGGQAAAPIVEAVATPVSQLGAAGTELGAAGTTAAETAATAAGADAALGGAAAAGTEAAAAAAAAEAAAAGTAAAGAGAGGAMAAVGTAMPWVGAGLLAGSALGLWADGGPVPHEPPRGIKRRDFDRGGKINGPGTETSDSIPALVSDGEYVLNAEAVKQVGKKKLDAMNAAGLKARAKKGKSKDRRYAEGGEVEQDLLASAQPEPENMTIDIDFGDGQPRAIPLMVPTLTPEETQYLAAGGAPTHPLVTKAVAYAQSLMAHGVDPSGAAQAPAQRMQGMQMPQRAMPVQQPQMQGMQR